MFFLSEAVMMCTCGCDAGVCSLVAEAVFGWGMQSGAVPLPKSLTGSISSGRFNNGAVNSLRTESRPREYLMS